MFYFSDSRLSNDSIGLKMLLLFGRLLQDATNGTFLL